uniref:Uncharacterized protein n=1 Tax=Setaria italica TaxID=4555 RepID=K4A425_SETIT
MRWAPTSLTCFRKSGVDEKCRRWLNRGTPIGRNGGSGGGSVPRSWSIFLP